MRCALCFGGLPEQRNDGADSQPGSLTITIQAMRRYGSYMPWAVTGAGGVRIHLLRDETGDRKYPHGNPPSPCASLDRNLITVTPGRTWMDTAFTPRNGKPVEVNALWIHSLDEAEDLGIPVPTSPVSARREFQRFWNKETGCLSDLIDPEDHSIRPNQVIAIALGMTGQRSGKSST